MITLCCRGCGAVYGSDRVGDLRFRLFVIRVCHRYVFGREALAFGVRRNAQFQRRFGGATPGSGELPASRIYFMDFSDDPWQAASVRRQISDDLP